MKKYLFYLLIILFVSCSNTKGSHNVKEIEARDLDSAKVLVINKDSVVDVDVNRFLGSNYVFDFTSLIKKMSVIKLETNDNSLIGEGMKKTLVTDNYIYIWEVNEIVIFDIHGKFIKRIRKGKGPGELYRLCDIAFDKENNHLIAYVHPYLYFYTADGKYIRSQKLPFGFRRFLSLPEGYVFKKETSIGLPNKYKSYKLLITDKKFKVKYIGLKHDEFPGQGLNGWRIFHVNKTIDITEVSRDTIYQYDALKNKLRAKFILNYKDKRLPDKYLYRKKADFDKAMKNNDYYTFIGDYFNTGSHSFFDLKNFYNDHSVKIYRDNNTGHVIGGTFLRFDFTQIPVFLNPRSTYGNNFVSYFAGLKHNNLLKDSKILSEEDKEKIINRKIEDNPFLILYQLKDF